MTNREKFLAIFKSMDPTVPTLKWEFGYWGGTINNWYTEGLPKKNPARMPDKTANPTSSLFLPAWTCKNKYVAEGEYPQGYVLTAGGLYWPTQGLALDSDVREHFNMDYTQQIVDVNLLFYPKFPVEVIEDNDDVFKYQDIDGVIRLYLKETGVVPCGWKWLIKDRASWEKIKEERLSLNNIRDRLPSDWAEKVKEYNNRDYALGFGGMPFGFFGTLSHLIGYEELFVAYYEEPELVHDIMDSFTNIWIAVLAEVLKDVKLDFIQIWEDISYGSGSMISKGLIREFMLPYYKRLTGFAKENDIDVIFVDTDGNCWDIISLFVEGGATAMFPFEVHAGMDVLKVREAFPKLAICGGINKSDISLGKEKIDEILEPVKMMLKYGGYVPHGDHLIPPEVHFKEFEYYRSKLNDIIDGKY